MNLPRHKCGLYLTHNQHKDYYQNVDEWIMDSLDIGSDYNWVSPEQKEKAIREDSVWVLQWYPHTPVSFYRICSADLDILLQKAQEIDANLNFNS